MRDIKQPGEYAYTYSPYHKPITERGRAVEHSHMADVEYVERAESDHGLAGHGKLLLYARPVLANPTAQLCGRVKTARQ